MNAADNPLVRSRTPFERRTHEQIASGKPRPIGGSFRALPGNTSFETRSARSRGTFTGCWAPSLRLDGEQLKISLTQGYVTDGTSVFTPDVSEIDCPSVEGTLYHVYLVVSFTTTEVDGYVTGGSISSITLEIDDAIPDNTSSVGYILLCSVQDGLVAARHSYWSLGVNFLAKDSSGGVYFRYYAAS